MFGSKEFSTVFVVIFIFTGNALGDLTESLDDRLGREYVPEDVEHAKRQMLLDGYGYGTDWVVLPDGNGVPKVALLKMQDDNKVFAFATKPVEKNVKLTLFTKNNRENGERINATNLGSSKFDASKATKIIIHGWQSSADTTTVKSIRDAYLNTSDVNVISVDWSEVAGTILYPAAASYTKKVGRYLAGIIDQLVETKGAKYGDFHVVGHSLGAHTAGVAGFAVRQKLARITGLDPALPRFQDKTELEDKLDESDAKFVEVIHTCAGLLGMSTPVGHADFYPNGGSPYQPGCCCLNELVYSCSHGRSHKYFAESILSEKSFKAVKCDTWNNFKNETCGKTVIPMGEYTPTSARGVFYLQTNSESPFGLGIEGIKFHPLE